MGEKEMFDYWKDTYKVQTLGWSQAKAEAILAEWQAKFTEEVTALVEDKSLGNRYNINAFSSSHLNEILEAFSEISFPQILLGYALMVRKSNCQADLFEKRR